MTGNEQQRQATPQPVPLRDPRAEIAGKGGMRAKPLPSNPFSILNLEDFIETVDVAPTEVPKSFYDSVKIVVDDLGTPTTYELYMYARNISAWVKFTGAAA